jgi:hydroxymethylpyrimidine/phosphomethylpyrimidine kinase
VTATAPNVLSIAGSDPSGGAGIQADLKTFAALGAYGCAAPTALTVQNTLGVSSVFPVPVDVLRAQLEAVFLDVRIDAVKIGMLGSSDAVSVVADVLCAFKPPIVVIDPVLKASTGARLIDDSSLDALRQELLPLATVVTPNTYETAALLGISQPRSVEEARKAAGQLIAAGLRAALVTGGHLDDGEGEFAVDVLHDGQTLCELRTPRVSAPTLHGTGCTLSSAIAVLLAHGLPIADACATAQRFVAESIVRGNELAVGRGPGPVHQLGELWSRAGVLMPPDAQETS